MATAMLHPEPAKGGRGKKASKNEAFGGAYLSNARTVLRAAPDVAAAVLQRRADQFDSKSDS